MQDRQSRSFSQKDAARRNAEKHFSGVEQRNGSVTQQASVERAASDANTARLRALRLEKEEAERAAGTALSPTGKPATT
jgi:hypothetical protein